MTLLLAIALLGAGPSSAQPHVSLAPEPPGQQTPKPAPNGMHHKPAARHAVRRPTRRAASIGSTRARQIQDALISAGYLTRASGRWDAATIAAMKRFQAEHHWQTRYLPDARALIALGLGPGQASSTAAAPAAPGSGRGSILYSE